MSVKKLRLMTVVGTRPEIIKMSEIIKKADRYFEHTLVHTGQNYDYELNRIFFEELGLREPDYYLDVVGSSLGETMGNVIAKSYGLMQEVQPDAVIVLGDTNSCLCVIAAKRLKVPIFHMEAGNRCRDENLPEEVIRRIVDVTSDVNLCYSEQARKYILDTGVKPEYTFVVGSPMAEVLTKYGDNIENSTILGELGLEKNRYILLSAHREENMDIEDHFFSLMNAVNGMAEHYSLPILYSCHPRSERRIRECGIRLDENVIRHKPLGFFDYNHLQKNAFCVVSDSGTLPEEAAYFKFPAVSIRTSTERPEAVDKGVFVLGGISTGQVLQAVDMAVSMHGDGDNGVDVPGYTDTNVSAKVVRIIQSYAGIIDQMIWRKKI